MPGRPEQVLHDRALAQRRRVVGRARTEAGDQLLDLQLEHAGDELGGVAQQLVHGAGGHRSVEPALLARRAEDVAAVAARDEVAALEADDAVEEAGAGGIAKPDRLALHRPHRHARRVGDAADQGRGGAGGDQDALGEHSLAGRERGPIRAAVLHEHLRDLRSRPQLGARGARGGGQRLGHEARVDGVVVRQVKREPDRRRKRRLERASPRRRHAVDSQPHPLAQLELALERLGLVAVPRDQERPARPVADVDAGDVAELLGEARPPPRALHAEHEQVALAGIRLGGRCEHPRRDAPGAVGELAAVEHTRREVASSSPPRHREPDDPAADDGYVVGGAVDDVPPRFAGMTRISS